MALLIPASVGGISTMKDRSMKITLYTPELPFDKGAELLKMNGKEGVVAFSLEEISNADLANMDKVVSELGGRQVSHSEHLRKVLYAYWKKVDDGKVTEFKHFYERYMQGLIDDLKHKMNVQGF